MIRFFKKKGKNKEGKEIHINTYKNICESLKVWADVNKLVNELREAPMPHIDKETKEMLFELGKSYFLLLTISKKHDFGVGSNFIKFLKKRDLIDEYLKC